MQGGSAARWEGAVLIRNRFASSYRSRMTSGISVLMERKPLRVAPATRDLGGDGDMGTPVVRRRHSPFPGWWNPSSPHRPVTGGGHPGVLRGDVGNAQPNNSPITPCDEPPCCSGERVLVTGGSTPKETSGRRCLLSPGLAQVN